MKETLLEFITRAYYIEVIKNNLKKFKINKEPHDHESYFFLREVFFKFCNENPKMKVILL